MNSHRIYASTAGDGQVHTWQIDEGLEHWRHLQALHLGGAIMPMAFSPCGSRLHAVDRQAPFTAHTLAVDANSGLLSPLGQVPLAGNMVYIATTDDGGHALTASYGEDCIAVHPLTPDGTLGAVSQVLRTPRQAHAIRPSPDGRHVWVSCLGADRLLAWSWEGEQPALTAEPVGEIRCRAGSGPRHFVFHPTQPWLFVLNELDGTIDAWRIDQPSQAAWMDTVAILPPSHPVQPWSAELRVSPDGRWLFASDRRAHTLSAINIDPMSGRLQRVDCVETLSVPRSFALSHDGRALFVASQASGELAALAFDPDAGRLTPRSQVSVGPSPTWVETPPSKNPCKSTA